MLAYFLGGKERELRGLQGKRVIITGGTSGIGEATSRRFIAEGAHVVAFAHGREEIASAATRIPGIVAAVDVDVAEPVAVAAAFAQSDRLFLEATGTSGVDILINNAGISIRHPFLDIEPQDWQRVVGVNLNGMFYCAQQAAHRMMSGTGGVILMTASTNGLVGHPYYADYNASKAGVILLTRTMALELAPKLRVNCVCPGYVLTPMQAAEYTSDMLEAVNARIPLGRHARPEEVAGLFAFLASDEGAYLNGAAIPMDGGETAGGLASRA
jgi:meso-butanediol dehydrogenase / (S,S)-butanediol dehydrogenase / diacetyl reductase